MCARRISNRLCGEWKLKRASGHQWKQIKYAVIVAHKGKFFWGGFFFAYLVHSCQVAVGAMVTKTHNLHAFLSIAV